ncbi:DUF3380 domain-containing protein [Roseomonas sp. SSH11]|uniref:DUF3380 domain-containing protein n=1 Tax=Pararoseomonas baculiformis TaxID=2820812 RepID=A0ABS4AKK7_9PROT|nr:N-acetylmuramidase domain-containing protein [Pararoseomonas baculiformis]MBP0447541.1 DUF3380 domain-containing protein [Pararoseomonas baculiformis]
MPIFGAIGRIFSRLAPAATPVSFETAGPSPAPLQRDLTEADLADAAARLGSDLPAIKAVAEVESGGPAFLADGRPAILYESHVFDRLELPPSNRLSRTLCWNRVTYGGGLFETDPAISKLGAALAGIALPDTVFEPVLRGLLLDQPKDLAALPARPVDFRSLRVWEFGTIDEGLLESELAVADTDLTLKRQGKDLVYVPAKAEPAGQLPGQRTHRKIFASLKKENVHRTRFNTREEARLRTR